MSGNHSRNKGAAGEREVLRLLPGATRVSGMYKAGPDLHWRGLTVEVKRRKAGAFAMDYRWLQQADIVIKRADRDPWMVTLPLELLLELLPD